MLVLGATSMVPAGPTGGTARPAPGSRVPFLERRPVRLVTVALANKMARIAWASDGDAQGGLPSEGRCRGRSASDCLMLSHRMAGGGRKPA